MNYKFKYQTSYQQQESAFFNILAIILDAYTSFTQENQQKKLSHVTPV